LVSGPKEELTDVAHDRLEAMVQTTDGFELAERDLEIRGEGQLLGARQSGLSDLRFTRLRQDQELLDRARRAAVSPLDEGLLGDAVAAVLAADHLGAS
jgi:ATP-dependent DNA helicase RecG